jgi:hypothetical protein
MPLRAGIGMPPYGKFGSTDTLVTLALDGQQALQEMETLSEEFKIRLLV